MSFRKTLVRPQQYFHYNLSHNVGSARLEIVAVDVTVAFSYLISKRVGPRCQSSNTLKFIKMFYLQDKPFLFLCFENETDKLLNSFILRWLQSSTE